MSCYPDRFQSLLVALRVTSSIDLCRRVLEDPIVLINLLQFPPAVTSTPCHC